MLSSAAPAMRVWQQDYELYDDDKRMYGAWQEVSTAAVPITMDPAEGPIGSDGSLPHPTWPELARMAWAVAQVDWHTGAPKKVLAGTMAADLPRPSSTMAEHAGAVMCAQITTGAAEAHVDNAWGHQLGPGPEVSQQWARLLLWWILARHPSGTSPS